MKRPWLRVLIASILSFILFAVLGCAGALWYIQDPVRLRPLLGKILDKFATEYGVQITFSEARFNLLSGLHLRGLQAHFAANGTRIDAQIESLDLDYAFHVFTFDPAARKITISRFRVLRPRIAIEQTPEPEARSQSNSTQTLDALAAKFSGWLDSPWATLAIADFSVDGLDLALKVGANRELRISSVTLAADAKIERGRAQLNLRSQNYGGGQLRFGARKSAGETLADLKSWKTKWEFLIEKTDSILKFKIARGELALKLQRLRTTKYSAKKIAILAKLALAPDHDFSVYGRKEEVGHVEFSVALDAQLAGAHAKLQARGGATASAARQNVRATTELDVKNQTWGHWLAISKINVERENQRLAGQIDLDLPSVPLKMAWLRDAVIRASGEIRDQKKWTIQNFAMALGGKNIQLSGAAAGTLPSKDFRANAELQVSIPGEITVLDKTTYIGGRLAVPVQIAFARGRDIDIDGSMKFVDFRWRKGLVATTGINGSAPFAERLQWDGQHLKFSDKILENPFERVSFDRLRPLIQNTDQLTIQKLSWREKSYGPLAGYFSLRQNMLLARQFDLDIGSGRTYGEMFLNLDPSAMRLGLLARLTALDLNKSLPASFLRNVPAGVNALNARAGLVLDIDKSTLDGRVDVGEMGGAQLIALINVFDPLYKNEKMNRARRALAVGYPTSMTLLFDNGFMGLDVAIRALGLSQSESVRGISIAKLLSSATADISLKAKKGILQ